jgi:hypothetical protein
LPFITRISKYYDLSIFDYGLFNSKSSSSTIGDNKSSENQFNYKDVIKDGYLTDTINSTSKYNNYNYDVMKAMQTQILKSDPLNGIIQEEMTDKDWDNLISHAH